MPSVDVVEVPGVAVIDGVKERYICMVDLEGGRHDLGCEQDALLHVLESRGAAQRSPNSGHHDRRRKALPHDIAKGHGDEARVGLVPVVEVAAYLPRRREVCGHLELLALERRGWEHACLERRR